MSRLLLGLLLITGLAALAGCSRIDHIGKAPDFSAQATSPERVAMIAGGVPTATVPQRRTDNASLWSGGQRSLLGDRRAMKRGDILTVVIEIDEEAAINNSTERSRSGSDSLGIGDFFGFPERINQGITDGASLDSAVSIDSSSESSGDGSVRRSEELTLRVAATVTDVLPNGVLAIVPPAEATPAATPPAPDAVTEGREYAKMNNQFVIPVISNERVASLVVASLSLEVPEGASPQVFDREPKLRDAFLGVLMDHASVGGFDGNFTSTTRLASLRTGLLEATRPIMGNLVSDVLITELARQDN